MLQWRTMLRWWKSWRWPLAAILVAAALTTAAELALRSRYRRHVLPRVAPAPGQATVVALGDSIAAGGWPALLAERLRAAYPAVTWRMVNAGLPGDTAPRGYARFERDAAAAGPQAALIAFGLNDCYPARHGMDREWELSVPNGLERSYLWRAVQARIISLARRGRPLPAAQPEEAPQPFPRTSAAGFADALAALVAATRAIGARPVLVTMTPLADAETEATRSRAATYAAYNRIIRTVASQARVPLVALALRPADGIPLASILLPDGVHLTAAGQDWAAEQIFRQLAAAGFWQTLAEEAAR